MNEARLQLSLAELRQSLANLKLERDAIVLYEALSEIERDPDRAAAFRRIAANERRHAEVWASRLVETGASVPPAAGPRLRVRFIIAVARLFGTNAVSDMVQALEGDEEAAYGEQLTPETAAIAADEREHAEIWQHLQHQRGRKSEGRSIGDEAWHRGGRSGTLRAAVFGANDGLVSNLSLVMGVAGAMADNRFIVLAGIAGLLAGAFSMTAGEYISMQSQRELFENQIALEREEMRVMPDVEQEELAQIFRAKGISAEDSQRIAAQLMEDPEKALDTKAREELGLDPQELGSPWGAAWSSFVAFSIGAILPLMPVRRGTGTTALIAALGVSFAALFALGAAVSMVTGRGVLFSGGRQVLIGAAAAAVTYAIGTLIGSNLGTLG